MAIISIMRLALKHGAKEITDLATHIAYLKAEIACWKEQEETAFVMDAKRELKRCKAKLTVKVDKQKRMKAEVATYFRNQRIARKYEYVFGKPPVSQTATSYEMEDMLDTLIAEKEAEAALAVAE